MKKHYYIRLPKNFCETHKEHKEAASKFGFAVGKDGLYYVSVNTLNEFPELFEGFEEFDIVSLSREDFPDSEVKRDK